MFATIAGPYPPIDGVPDDGLAELLADQLEAGLGMLGEGRVHALAVDHDVDAAVRAWRAATAFAGELAQAGEVPAPPVKACLLGPLSLAGRAREAGTSGRPSEAVARVRAAILALHAAGAPVVQVDEPWTGGAAPAPDAAPAAAPDAVRALAADTWTAMLDGVTGHVSLALPGGGATQVGADTMVAAPFSSYLVDLITGPDDWREVGRLPGDRGVVLGVADLRPGRGDTREVLVWAARHAASMRGRGLDRVGLTTSAGLETLPREVARARLRAIAEAAALGTLQGADLARRLDPRAIDARSAALGRWEPRPGGRRATTPDTAPDR